MRIICRKCAREGDFTEFKYIGMGWCPGVEIRRCPTCDGVCIFDKGDSLEDEHEEMKVLVEWLAAIPGNAPQFLLDEARRVISQLSRQNMRWNIPQLDDFITQRQKELGLVR